jgi:hypothetical protein
VVARSCRLFRERDGAFADGFVEALDAAMASLAVPRVYGPVTTRSRTTSARDSCVLRAIP